MLEQGDVEFLWQWISGADHQELQAFFLPNGKHSQMQLDRAITESIHTVESMHSTLSWTLYALQTLLEYLSKQMGGISVSTELGNFPLYIKYGVNHPLALFVLDELEWPHRRDAMRLSSGLPGHLSYFKDRDQLQACLRELGESGMSRRLDSVENARELWRRFEIPF
jgi:hypothetical protein